MQSFGRCFSFSGKIVSFSKNSYAFEKKENLLTMGRSKKQLYMFFFLCKIADILVFINISLVLVCRISNRVTFIRSVILKSGSSIKHKIASCIMWHSVNPLLKADRTFKSRHMQCRGYGKFI